MRVEIILGLSQPLAASRGVTVENNRPDAKYSSVPRRFFPAVFNRGETNLYKPQRRFVCPSVASSVAPSVTLSLSQ